MSDINEIATHTENVLNHPPSIPSDREDKAMFDMNVTCRIDNKLDGLSSMQVGGPLPRVPNHLRRVNEKAYDPDIISIGPYHRGKSHLAIMEKHKLSCLKSVLTRRNESSVARYVEALIKLNERAKNCYEKQVRKETQAGDFLETMLVDGCFIVELIRMNMAEIIPGLNQVLLRRDLLLLENQLPFSVLQKLFDMTLLPNDDMTSLPNEPSNLEDSIIWFFGRFLGLSCKGSKHNLPKAPVHLLGFMHDYWFPSSAGMMTDPNKKGQEEQGTNDAGIKLSINCGLRIDCSLICRKEASKEDDAEAHIPCATRLHEAGIEFKMAEGCSIFDIKFAKGVLEIPKLRIEDDTESLLRNLIAYEQFWKNDTSVTDYARFMDWLVNSDKDVELLCRSGIIDNWLGNDEVITTMFNKLSDNVIVSIRSSIYSEIYKKVDKHYGRKWNLWKAKLRHDYFNGPWALISFLAAVFLLILTVLQTVCSVLSVHHS